MLPLIPILNRNKELLEKLLGLLALERNAFGLRETQELETVTAVKKEVIEELESLEKKQYSVLTKFGVINPKKPVKGAFKAWLNEQDSDSEICILVEECEALLIKCKSKNTANEQILNTLRKRNQAMLEILKGQSKNHRVYTAKGASKPVSSKHTIGNA
ncbi:flagellar protein FlgN [Marinomonas agarivorans]|nr:flagellar protein FlgN [Marinomonas agarivorans]